MGQVKFNTISDSSNYFLTYKEIKSSEESAERGIRNKSKSPCMIVFCNFEQQFYLINLAKEYGLNRYINLVFRKNFSAQVLKANMKIVGNCEYALILYRDRLPKFNNNGKMIFNCMDIEKDMMTKKIHPTQKNLKFLDHAGLRRSALNRRDFFLPVLLSRSLNA